MGLTPHEIELMERCGEVTCEEAKQIAGRYNASHFSNRADMGERARYSIPADHRRDDDLRLAAFIAQHKKLQDELDATRAKLTREENATCAVCVLLTGEPCKVSQTGLESEEVMGLRKECHRLQGENAALREQLAQRETVPPAPTRMGQSDADEERP